jgi:hypothetical protein
LRSSDPHMLKQNPAEKAIIVSRKTLIIGYGTLASDARLNRLCNELLLKMLLGSLLPLSC